MFLASLDHRHWSIWTNY